MTRLRSAIAGFLRNVADHIDPAVTFTKAGRYYDGPKLTLSSGTWEIRAKVILDDTTPKEPAA